MKKKILILLLSFCSITFIKSDTPQVTSENVSESVTDTSSDLILLDQIDVVIVGREEAEIITHSDLERQSLGGGYRSEDDVIFEKIVLLDAKKHQIPDDPEAVDAGFAQMQREHNLTRDDIEQIFEASGYTYEEGREQFQVMQMVNTMLDLKVRSNLIVPRKDVETYYENHPEVVEATYTLERLFVPFSPKVSKKAQLRKINHFIKTGRGLVDLEQGVVFVIAHSEVAPQKQFIYTMEIGDVSQPEQISDGFEMFRLIDKTPEYRKTLEESYREIVDILRRPKYEELVDKYRNQLLESVSVITIR